MVHKKTEYRLQFQLLAKDLRKQIWQDNIQFRESHRSLNQAHHYWSYQLTDEKCECENGEEDEDEAALPPHKLKHKILLAQYGSAKSNIGVQDVPKPHVLSSPSQVQSDTRQQVQVPSAQNNALLGTDMASQIPGQESTEQRLTKESNNEIQNLSQSLSTVPKAAEEHTVKEQQKCAVPSRRSITIQDPHSQHRLSNKAERCGTSTSLRHSETSIQPSLSRKSGLTRTTRKAYFEQKRSPFAFFGWNESDRNIGQKKTYNVYAPDSEVHSAALLALKRRRTEIERYLAEEAQKRKQQLSTAPEVSSPVNHSSIWMTEYQEKFTHGNRFKTEHLPRRPASAPPCRIQWRQAGASPCKRGILNLWTLPEDQYTKHPECGVLRINRLSKVQDVKSVVQLHQKHYQMN